MKPPGKPGRFTADLRARLSWLALALVVLLAATPFLDRFAAHAGARGASRGCGSRLRWLDAVLAPLQRTPFGALVAAELRLVLREHDTRTGHWCSARHLLVAGYVSVQGAWVLNAQVAPAMTLTWHAALLPLAAVLLVVGWRRAA